MKTVEGILLDVGGAPRSTVDQLRHEATGARIFSPEAHDVVLTLFRRGYRLGLVSNTASSVEILAALKELHLTGCFETVILPAVAGTREPRLAILLEATRRMSLAPEKCAYIGDRVDGDVAAARRAGFSEAIILDDPSRAQSAGEGSDPLGPDAVVPDLPSLLEIFPPRPAPRPAIVYDASLSTMWAINNFPTLADFFEAARRMGFSRIELGHHITTSMLAGIELNGFQFSSIHEPCPTDFGEAELKRRDWLISSTDEACRLEGVRAIQRSIDLARQVAASAIVIHAGHSTVDKDKLERKLRAMIAAGQRHSDEYHAIHGQLVKLRAEHAPAGLESVRKSMLELLAYAAPFGIRLGLENRNYYVEYPSPDELGLLLSLAGPEQIGFVYDIGHAEAQSRLGLIPNELWLGRFASRIIGVHLHDVAGTSDHYAPGLGDVDFTKAGASLPQNCFRTCEFQTFNTPEQVKAGLAYLAEHGCIKTL